MASRKKAIKKYKTTHTGKVENEPDHGMVLYLIEQKWDDVSYGISSGGLIDARLAGKRVKVTIEEL